MFLNEAQVSLTGYVATQPVTRMVKSGETYLSVLSMRVAWTPRRHDRVTGEWMDGNTSYVTVLCWRKLATNAGLCVRKGDPVIVQGRLAIRTYEDKQGMQRIATEIEATTVGHDLSRGVALFQRVRPQTGLTASEYAASDGSQPRGDDALGSAGEGGTARASGPAVGGSVSPPDEDAEALVGVSDSDFTLPDGPGADDPFFSTAGESDQAGDPEPVAAPF